MKKQLVEIARNSLIQKTHNKDLDIVKNKTVLITSCVNSFMSATFPYAETVFFNHCEKNFTYYNLNTLYFPNVSKIYLNCHPCEKFVLTRHYDMYNTQHYKLQHKCHYPDYKPNITVYFIDYWKDYYQQKWKLDKYDFIKGISDDEFSELIHQYEKEDLDFELRNNE
jgi:hypothetical protein